MNKKNVNIAEFSKFLCSFWEENLPKFITEKELPINNKLFDLFWKLIIKHSGCKFTEGRLATFAYSLLHLANYLGKTRAERNIMIYILRTNNLKTKKAVLLKFHEYTNNVYNI